MTSRVKRNAVTLGTFLVLAAVAYIVGTRQGAPMPEPAVYEREQIEVHSYGLFLVPGPRDSLRAVLNEIQWRLANPGHARILSAVARVERKAPNRLLTPQQVFEELGYKFPPGCYARAGVGGCTDVAHYPAVLRKMEKRLDLHPVREWRVEPSRPRSPSYPAGGSAGPTPHSAIEGQWPRVPQRDCWAASG